MRTIRYLLQAFLCLALVISPAFAAGAQQAQALQEERLELDKLERAAEQQLDGVDLKLGDDWQEGLDELLDTGTAQLGGIVRKAVHSVVLLLVVVLLCSLAQGLTLAGGERGLSVIPLVGALAVTAVAVTDVNSMLGLGRSAITSMSELSNVLLPAVAAVTAATGAITGAAARQMAALLFSDVLINLIEKLLIPMLYGYIAASVAYASVGSEGLKRVGELLKWAVVTILTILMLTYVGYLTVSGAVAGSTDAAAVKAAKFAVSGAVPIVGGILADASESVLAAAGVLRGTVGVFGVLVVFAVCLIPFLQLAVHYLLYKLCAALAATVDGGRVSGLIDSLSGAFGLILGMTGACALLLLVCLFSSISVVTV